MNLLTLIIKKISLIFISFYKVAKLSSFNTYIELFNDNSYFKLSTNRTTTVYPISFFNETEKTPIKLTLEDTFYAIIHDCSIIGESNLVLTKENLLLYDTLVDKSNSHVNVTDKGLFLLFNKLIHVGRYYILNYLKNNKSIEKGIMLSGNFSNNYYHFVLEFIVKFELINQSKINPTIPLILDSRIKKIPQFEELIAIFNKDNRYIKYIESKTLYSINELHFLSFVNKIPANFKSKKYKIQSTDFAFDFNSVEFVRQTVYKYFENKIINTNRKIFISRKKCLIRRNNEEELYPILLKYGYQIIFPEELSLQEQFSYFANAEHIIAATGAALTNVLFCKPKCEVLVFQPTNAETTVFSSIAAHIKLNMIYLTGKNKTSKRHPDFEISMELLEEYLQKYDRLKA